MKVKAEVFLLKITRTIFQDSEPGYESVERMPKFILILDMEEQAELSTADISDLPVKMEMALPGIFPNENSQFVHSCGGCGCDEEHPLREEIERGTNIPHLFEHVLLHLLSRRQFPCSAYCGQRSVDIERGISTIYYLVMDYPSKLEAIVAADLGFKLISAWIEGNEFTLDPAVVLADINDTIEPMINHAA